MLNKIKTLPHKVLFLIGLVILFIGSALGNTNIWFIILGGILYFIAFIFVLAASDKKHIQKINK